VICHVSHPFFTGAVGATVERTFSLNAVADDLAAAMAADGRQFLDGALEAVKDVPVTGGNDFKGHVIIVTAHFTTSHLVFLLVFLVECLFPALYLASRYSRQSRDMNQLFLHVGPYP